MVQDSLPSQENGRESRDGPAPYDYGGVGGYILAGLILFGGLGLWLDRVLGLSFLTPFGLVLGVVAGGYLVYVRVVRTPVDQPADAAGQRNSSMVREEESR